MPDDIKQGLQKALAMAVGNNQVRLPRDVSFTKKGDVVTLHFHSIDSNMQTDAGAFEGWLLVLKSLYDGNCYENLCCSWERSYTPNDGHYQRFLYRMIRFRQQVDWFRVAPESEDHLNDSIVLKPDGSTKPDTTFFINMPSRARDITRPNEHENSSRGSEHDLEKYYYSNPTTLLEAIGWQGDLQRQLPVGVFSGSVSDNSRVFSGGKSAVDLWSFDTEKGIALFELKKPDNCKVGAISELFFYCSVIKDVAEGVFQYENPCEYEQRLLAIRRVTGFILAGKLHPLLANGRVVELLNRSFNPQGMFFGYLQYDDNLKIKPLSSEGLPVSLHDDRVLDT